MNSSDVPPDSPLSEADIQAYADGSLSPERAAFLRDYLGKQPTEARRVAFYGRLNAQIQDAFQTTDEPLARPVGGWRAALARLRDAARRSKTTRTLLAALFVLTAASGWLAATQTSARALDNAAVMALAESSAEPFSAQTPTYADAGAPDLSTIGLRLVERRVISLGVFQRASEFIYLNGANQPVVLVSTLALLARTQPQWSARRIGDIRLLGWVAQRQRFVVAGDARTHGLMRAADAMTLH
ncbi:hypothetical protein P3T18_006754 [Paraburkholderia sp. GAS199]|uniref:anti-sigma factor family protein n=1 Tax=Paraburkholderia sp. GAS199 TaxID=3035126 RepID=UPI003D1C8C2F